ncbi:MAG: 4-hydroxybenzoate octaprenyltransferase [Pseudomonadota bacterium]
MSTTDAPLTPDALQRHWSLRLLPSWARPYGRLMRLERPVGWQLLLYPCLFGSLLASIALEAPIAWNHLGLFFLGSIIMRGAGCTLNDVVDRDIDAKVARTAQRPIPSGEVGARQAAIFLTGLLVAGFAILVTFNMLTIAVGIGSLALIAIYPFMKRITNWPQLVLGLVFAWGALVGWTAQVGTLSWELSGLWGPTNLAAPNAWAMVCAYFACVLWIVGFDTIYAFQDLEDDALAGVGSSAQALGRRAPLFITFSYAAFIALMGAAMAFVGAGILSFAGLVAALAHLAWQVKTLDLSDASGCLHRFRSNGRVGLLLTLGLALDAFL